MKRSYSRRELYALGEPLGDSATYRKAGGLVLGDGGGGGGSAPAAPDKTTQTVELPEWAQPYAKNVLARGAALTDINQNPYQQYGGNRIAGFSPMQMQSFQGAANMNAGPQGFQEQVGQYMSPYMQNVVDVEKRGAIRDYQVGNTMQQAQATQAGAFGGGREAIQRAERERGLMGTLGGIQARGSQAAFDQASNQFRQGIQQGVAVNQLQNQYGGQMQQQAQRPLDMAYQDFQNQQNYPYKQLGFMSDLVRGMPLGQQSTESIYSQGPSTVQTLAGLGGAAYGFGKSGLFGKEGGLMSSYASGGEVKRYAGNEGSVTSQDNKDSIVEGMYSMEGLQKAKEAALARRDVDTANAIDERIAELNALQAQTASLNNGLGSAFDQIPQNRQEEMMAGGGIVAFAPGGLTYRKQAEDAMAGLEGLINKYPTAQTPEEYESAVTKRMPMVEKIYGPDITKPYLEETKTKRAGLADQMEKDKGLAIAMASLGLLSRKKTKGESQKSQLISGLGEAGQQFAGEVGRLKKESREADDKLRQSEITLATAQQARREGLAGKAMGLEDKARTEALEGYKSQMGIQEKLATIKSNLASTEMQGKTHKEIAAMNAAVHRDVANKPGELERIIADVEAIRSGKKSFAGKTGEEGAQAYQDTLTKVGEARGGYRYSGPDKSPEQAAAIRKQALDDDRVKDAGLAILAAGSDPAKKQAARENYDRILQSVEQGLRDQIQARPQRSSADTAGAPGKSTAAVGKTPPPPAVDMLKLDPSAKNRKDFDEIFGPGAAAKVLGN